MNENQNESRQGRKKTIATPQATGYCGITKSRAWLSFAPLGLWASLNTLPTGENGGLFSNVPAGLNRHESGIEHAYAFKKMCRALLRHVGIFACPLGGMRNYVQLRHQDA